MKSIMLSLPNYLTRVPDQSIIASPTFESASEAERGDSMISGMRGDGWCAVHLPEGGTVSVRLNKALEVGSKFRSWWIDPKTGGKTIFQTTDCVTLDPMEFKPSPSKGKQNDWLLLIEQVWDSPSSLS
jgi:hypothetical protein